MNVYDLLDEMDKLVDDAWSVPLSGGKTVLDAERVREIIDDLRNSIPHEIRQAKAITAQRRQILNEAKKEGDLIVGKAKEKAQELINQDEVVKQANIRAKEVITEAQKQANDIQKSADMYVNNFMKNIDQQLSEYITQFRQMRQNVKESQNNKRSF